jgi:hypothetical protein
MALVEALVFFGPSSCTQNTIKPCGRIIEVASAVQGAHMQIIV